MTAKKRSFLKQFSRQQLPTVFLNYAKDGYVYANKLTEALKENGIRVLNDNDFTIMSGELWIDRLQQNLLESDVLIYLATPSSLRSKWILEELRFSLQRKSHIIPIFFETHLEFVPFFIRDILWLKEEVEALERGPSKKVLEKILQLLGHFAKKTRTFTFGAKTIPTKRKTSLK
ncbi:MAG: toll/interleukin-1 receptor domain-containing protein [Nitrospirales bacterium]